MRKPINTFVIKGTTNGKKKNKKRMKTKSHDRPDVLLRALEIKESQWHDDEYDAGTDY